MNYQIIKDEQKLKEFIDWLPILENYEKYYLCLFARNKYCKELTHIKSDKSQLKRFLSNKETMYWKIKQLEVEIGAYRQKNNPIPQEALALYITPNPRSTWKATYNSLIKLSQCIRDNNISNNPQQEIMSEIQRAKSRTCYIDFDIDEKDENILANIVSKIKEYVNKDAITWLRTRGGLHVLIDPKKIDKSIVKTYYQNMVSLSSVDQTGDQLIPVIGCTQGQFIPHFVNY